MKETIERGEQHLARLSELAALTEARSAQIDQKLKLLTHATITLERLELQALTSHPRFASPLRLERFGRKTFSQNDEDGIIAEIFRRIGETSRVFVEIAAGDGHENCTALLLSQGWSGLWVECDAPNIESIKRRWPGEIASGQLKLDERFISIETVNNVIRDALGEAEIDLLVVDIDGNDHHLVNAIEMRPRAMCIECFSPMVPPDRWVMPHETEFRPWDGLRPTGASLQSFEDLLTPRGYSLVGTSLTGVNAFFVRSDLAAGKFQEPFTAMNHYNPPRLWLNSHVFTSAIWPDLFSQTPPDERAGGGQ